MTVTAYAVVNGSGRIVKVSARQFEMDRQRQLLERSRPMPGPYRVVVLTGEVERVESRKL